MQWLPSYLVPIHAHTQLTAPRFDPKEAWPRPCSAFSQPTRFLFLLLIFHDHVTPLIICASASDWFWPSRTPILTRCWPISWALSSLMQPMHIHVSFAHILWRAHSHRCVAQSPRGTSRPWSQTWSCKSFAAAEAKRLRADMSSLLITFHKPISLVKSCASVYLDSVDWEGNNMFEEH